MSTNQIRLFASLVAAVCFSACTTQLKPAASSNQNGQNNTINLNGWTPPADYPAGPYGVEVGSTIADLTFLGVQDPESDINNVPANAANIHLSDFRGKDAVLMVTAAAGWCEYCNMEEPSVVSYYNSMAQAGKPLGILEILINDLTVGDPASMTFVETWANEYKVTFDMGIDPDQTLNPYYQVSALPMHMVITTADMKIQVQFVGQDDQGLQNELNYFLGCATTTSTSACTQ